MRNTIQFFILIATCSAISISMTAQNAIEDIIQFQELKDVKITDNFWLPKLKQWSTTTADDVLDKFEAKHLKDSDEALRQNVFVNFDNVAKGKSSTGHHAGLPWFDGLVYESIRGISDLLVLFPNKEMEKRIDRYIDRIYAAQQVDPDGYINTYTQLIEPTHRWGDNGGMLRFQHDVYNAGMLVEAGIHYYKATGKTKLLEIATRFADHMCTLMGPAPKRNIVPAHSGPEEAMIKLYWLYKNDPSIKQKLPFKIDENNYYALATFWIENRGNNIKYPLWLSWGNEKAEQWIKDVKYKETPFGKDSRPSWGDYAQDSISVFDQTSIEGHAVRATLLGTGITAAALENNSSKYIKIANLLWDNMDGRKMFITGGVGAIHHDEKFGPDYYLPTDAYLETCAAVGVGFFSQRMNQLTGSGKYMDELERTIYNSILTGISLSGNKYTYQNPLNAHKHERWEWHSCPCCPPMFLKIMSAMPGYIYAKQQDNVYVNLYVSSETIIKTENDNQIKLVQQTDYPWKGKVNIKVDPTTEELFSIKLRIPGWAYSNENSYGLYNSKSNGEIKLLINNQYHPVDISDGYATIQRIWKKGDKIELDLPMQPRVITADNKVKNLIGKAAIGLGPVIYCIEEIDNPDIENLKLNTGQQFSFGYDKNLLNGVNIISGKGLNNNGSPISVKAIPYYAAGNRTNGAYKVWIPVQKRK